MSFSRKRCTELSAAGTKLKRRRILRRRPALVVPYVYLYCLPSANDQNNSALQPTYLIYDNKIDEFIGYDRLKLKVRLSGNHVRIE
jgi:hypothetical protein